MKHLALGKEHADAVAARNADVCLARLSGTVDHTAHDRDGDGLFAVSECGFHAGGKGNEIDAGSAAGGAGDDVDPVMAKPGGFEDVARGIDLTHGICRQGHANRVADAHAEKAANAHGRLDDPHVLRSGLGHADVQRVIRLHGKELIGLHHKRHRARFHRHADIVKAEFFKQPNMGKRAFHQSFRRGMAVLFKKVFL